MAIIIEYTDYTKLKYRIQAGNKSASKEFNERILNNCELPLLSKERKPFRYVNNKLIKDRLNVIYNLYNQITVVNGDSNKLEAFYSCTIEGAITTVADTLRVSMDKSPTNKSEQMVFNTIKAIRYLNSKQTISDYESLINLWKIITKDVCDNESSGVDAYRISTVEIGNEIEIIYTTPNPNDVSTMMEDLFSFITNCNDINPIIKSIVIHFYFVYVHPFCDGNGRTARILLTQYLINNGFEKFNKISITSEVSKNLSNYYKSIRESEENDFNDITFFIVFYLNTIEDVLLRALEEFKPTEKQMMLLNDNQLKVLSWLNKHKGSYIDIEGYRKLNKNKIGLMQEVDIKLELNTMVLYRFLELNGNKYTLKEINRMEIF